MNPHEQLIAAIKAEISAPAYASMTDAEIVAALNAKRENLVQINAPRTARSKVVIYQLARAFGLGDAADLNVTSGAISIGAGAASKLKAALDAELASDPDGRGYSGKPDATKQALLTSDYEKNYQTQTIIPPIYAAIAAGIPNAPNIVDAALIQEARTT